MKKAMLMAAAFLVAVTSFAQVQIGAGYVNSTDRTKLSNDAEVSTAAANGVYAGLGVTLPLAGDLAVTPGVYYMFLTSHNGRSVANGILSASGDLQEHYVNVPIYFNYGSELAPNFRLFFFGGPTFSAGIISKTVLSASILGFSANTAIDNYRDVSGYGRFDVMLGGGMGVDLGKRLRLTVGYDFGMMNRYTEGNGIIRHRNQLHGGLAFLF
ncbi:MAG: PorT family protein [Bacteroidales bacterium]|nr:PorT family protein [Bacteroidales bacterium]